MPNFFSYEHFPIKSTSVDLLRISVKCTVSCAFCQWSSFYNAVSLPQPIEVRQSCTTVSLIYSFIHVPLHFIFESCRFSIHFERPLQLSHRLYLSANMFHFCLAHQVFHSGDFFFYTQALLCTRRKLDTKAYYQLVNSAKKCRGRFYNILLCVLLFVRRKVNGPNFKHSLKITEIIVILYFSCILNANIQL